MRVLDTHNILTILYSATPHNKKLTMFFDPYTQSITSSYSGKIEAVLPSYTQDDEPYNIVRPQRLERNFDINYVFKQTKTKNNSIEFYIQDQYFQDVAVKTYYCCRCQAPNLYFSDSKVVNYRSKQEVKRNDEYICINPLCKLSYKYLGMVKIQEVL